MTDGLRRGFVLLSLGQAVFLVSGYATHIILARGLGPADYGSYGVTLSILSTVGLVLSAGVPEAIAKFASERPTEANGIFARGIAIQLRFSLLLALAYAAASPLIGIALHDRELTPALLGSALAVPSAALYAVLVGALNGQRRFAAQALTIGGYGALRALLVIAFAQHFKLAGAVAGFVLAPLLVVSLVVPGVLRGRTTSNLESRELWHFARPIIGFTVALALLMSLDLFVVKGSVRDADMVGYYAAATTVAKLPYFVFSALGVALLPIVSAASAENRERMLVVVRNAIRLVFAVALGVAAVAAPLSQAVLHTLYGVRYTVAALPLGLLVIAMTLFTLTFIVAYALNGLGHPGLAMRLTVLGLGVEVLLALVTTPRFGPAGAAASSCIASLLILVALMLYARPYLGVVLSLKSLLRLTLACALTIAAGVALPHSVPLHLLMSVPLAVGFVGLLVLLREFTLSELMAFVQRRPA
jgi:O-antigen/teichoic acid export membrane protein